jgi:hypothetical protein
MLTSFIAQRAPVFLQAMAVYQNSELNEVISQQ